MEAYIIAGLSLAASVIISVMGYLMRDKMETLTTKVAEVERELTTVRINYVHKTDLADMRTEILNAIERLDNKLDRTRSVKE